jgi:hypothetical protein
MAVTKIDQQNIDIWYIGNPIALLYNIVVAKLIAPIIEEAPASCKAISKQSTPPPSIAERGG